MGFAIAAMVLASGTSQAYVIALDGADVGFAELTLERPGSQSEPFAYAFRAELNVSGDPCLRSQETSSGRAKRADAVLPEEVFVALGGELGVGCRKIRGAGQAGTGCWTESSPEGAKGTLFGVAVEVSYSANLMPESVRYPSLGLSYRAIPQVPEALRACHRTAADEGVAAPGASAVAARKLVHASYLYASSKIDVRAASEPLPEKVHAAVNAVRSQELSSCQEAALALVRELSGRGLPARAVAGLILDDGRFYPHAWTEVRIGKEKAWIALDATTSEGAADAGRLRVGLLGEFQTGLDLLKLLHGVPRLGAHD